MNKRILTEADVVSNPALVEKIKGAVPATPPMSGDELKKWLASIR